MLPWPMTQHSDLSEDTTIVRYGENNSIGGVKDLTVLFLTQVQNSFRLEVEQVSMWNLMEWLFALSAETRFQRKMQNHTGINMVSAQHPAL